MKQIDPIKQNYKLSQRFYSFSLANYPETKPYNKFLRIFFALLLSLCVLPFSGCTEHRDYGQYDSSTTQTSSQTPSDSNPETSDASDETISVDADGEVKLSEIPDYSGEPYIEVNDNEPTFTEQDKESSSFETYAPRDYEGRCGTAFALVSHDTMPTEERENISEVKPTGWQSVTYDIVEGGSLYNRCHLIGFQLTGENANWENLITGTRYLNTEGMLPFENQIDDYIDKTHNHVLYRVTPIYKEDELLARGVQMEALSIEDEGAGISFNVYCYNVQPGIEIDYQTGNNWESNTTSTNTDTATQTETTYILNTNSKRFHHPSCSSVESMSSHNRKDFKGSRETLISQGYQPCGQCNP